MGSVSASFQSRNHAPESNRLLPFMYSLASGNVSPPTDNKLSNATTVTPRHELSAFSPVTNAGHAVIHHQSTWHGSGPNVSPSRVRRALAVHMLRGDVAFVDRPGYIYGRYKLGTETRLHESFFPTTFDTLSPFGV